MFIEGRTPLLEDCFLDVSGGFVGILLFLSFFRKNKVAKVDFKILNAEASISNVKSLL
jgi:hypothetical protein